MGCRVRSGRSTGAAGDRLHPHCHYSRHAVDGWRSCGVSDPFPRHPRFADPANSDTNLIRFADTGPLNPTGTTSVSPNNAAGDAIERSFDVGELDTNGDGSIYLHVATQLKDYNVIHRNKKASGRLRATLTYEEGSARQTGVGPTDTITGAYKIPNNDQHVGLELKGWNPAGPAKVSVDFELATEDPDVVFEYPYSLELTVGGPAADIMLDQSASTLEARGGENIAIKYTLADALETEVFGKEIIWEGATDADKAVIDNSTGMAEVTSAASGVSTPRNSHQVQRRAGVSTPFASRPRRWARTRCRWTRSRRRSR